MTMNKIDFDELTIDDSFLRAVKEILKTHFKADEVILNTLRYLAIRATELEEATIGQ